MGKMLGKRLRRARLNQGISQSVLADKIGCSQPMIGYWESGRLNPSEAWQKKLTKVLGKFNVSRRELEIGLNGSESQNPTEQEGLFGEWLRKARESSKMTRVELAERSGVSMAQIFNLESGRSINPQETTRTRLEEALGQEVPEEIQEEVAEDQEIAGLGQLLDFDPYDGDSRPGCSGVYVFYDVSDRPVYVGQGAKIRDRVAAHSDKFWFKPPIVNYGSYIEIGDKELRQQVEQVLIKFLKSNAVINKQSVERS